MSHAARSLFVLAFAIASLGLAQPTAALDIRGPDGARIVIDGGIEHELIDGELFVMGLVPGPHTLRAEVEGYYPLETTFTLERGQVLAVTLSLDAIAPRTTTTRALLGATLVPTSAALSLQCFPMACELQVVGENGLALVGSKGFGEDTMIVSGLPAGAYSFTATATVTGEPRSIDFTAGLCDGETLMILVDFMAIPIVARFDEGDYPDCAPLPPVQVNR
jgi:hypothetical protein